MIGLCECGCGESTPLASRTDAAKGWVKGEPLRYVRWHKREGFRSGQEHPNFNGGLSYNERRNRWYVYGRDRSQMPYARAVMMAELGRELTPDEHVHHINGDSSDDRPENLQLVDVREHAHLHGRLTDDEVREIRRSRLPIKELGAKYEITPQYACQLRTGTATRKFGMEAA